MVFYCSMLVFGGTLQSCKDSEEQSAACLPDSANQINGEGTGTNVFVLVSTRPAKRGGGECPNETHANWTKHLHRTVLHSTTWSMHSRALDVLQSAESSPNCNIFKKTNWVLSENEFDAWIKKKWGSGDELWGESSWQWGSVSCADALRLVLFQLWTLWVE